MARINNLNNFLTDVADAIRSKTGGEAQIQAEDFDTEIRNIQSGMQMYSSEEEMQADTSKPEGTLAVVYSSGAAPILPNEPYNNMYFPKTIVFDTAVTVDISVNGDRKFVDVIGVSPSGIDFELQSMEGGLFQAQVFYNSSDGITYTREDQYEDGPFNDWMLKEAGYTWENDCLKFSSPMSTNYTLPEDTTQANIIKHVFTKYDNDFGGLFEYTSKQTEDVWIVTSLTKDGSTYSYEHEYVQSPMMGAALQDMMAQDGVGNYQRQVVYDSNTGYFITPGNQNNSGRYGMSIYRDASSGNMYLGMQSTSNDPLNITLNILDVVNGAFIDTMTVTTSVIGYYTSSNTSYYVHTVLNIGDRYKAGPFFGSMASPLSAMEIWQPSINDIDFTNHTRTYVELSWEFEFRSITKWYYAETSFTLTSPGQLLPGIKGYGNKGIVTGDSSVYNNIDMVTMLNSNNLVPFVDYTVVGTKNFGDKYKVYGNYIGDIDIGTDYLVEARQSSAIIPDIISNTKQVGEYILAWCTDGKLRLYTNTFELINTTESFGFNDITHLNAVLIDDTVHAFIARAYSPGYQICCVKISSTVATIVNKANKNVAFTPKASTYSNGIWYMIEDYGNSTQIDGLYKYQAGIIAFDENTGENTNIWISSTPQYRHDVSSRMAIINDCLYVGLYRLDGNSSKYYSNMELCKYNLSNNVMTVLLTENITDKLYIWWSDNNYVLYNKNVYDITNMSEPLDGQSYISNRTNNKVSFYYDATGHYAIYDGNSYGSIVLDKLNGTILNGDINVPSHICINADYGNIYYKEYSSDHLQVKILYRKDTLDADYNTEPWMVQDILLDFRKGISQNGERVIHLIDGHNIYMYSPKYGILNDPNIEVTEQILGES